MDEIKAYYALTQKAFDFLAPVYNVMTLPLVHVRNQVVDLVNAGAGSLVLDVATGTGQQAFAFAKRGHSVIGVDLTESMLEIARKHNKDNRVKFEIADATRLRFEENTFDVACISFALHDMPMSIRERVLREMMRVTKQDGSVVVIDYALPQNTLGRILIYRLIALYESEYYKQFMAHDLHGLLAKTGIEITEELPVLLGAGRILKGVKRS